MTTKSAQVRHVRVSLPLIECLVDGVRYFRKALHAKAKAEAGYRFYALYDKISRRTFWLMRLPSAAPTRLEKGRVSIAGGLAGDAALHRTDELLNSSPMTRES